MEEPERLQALRRYRILDTPPEPAFDRITRLAASLFGTPMAVVALVEADRTWVKSVHGEALARVQELDRAVSLCAEAIRSDEVMVIPDARADPRTAEMPLVKGPPGIRFYAGAPLITPDGYRVGTLGVADTQPRQFTAEERALLGDLAAMVVDELELRRQMQEIEELRQRADERLQAVLDASPVAIGTLDPEGRVTSWNRAAERMFGWTEEEVLGKVPPIVPPDKQEEFVGLRDRVLRGEPLSGVEVERIRKDGTRIQVRGGAAALRDRDGNVIGILGILEDITEQKRLLKALERLALIHQQAMDNSPNPIFWVDREGRILRWDPACRRVFGHDKEIVGQPYQGLLADPQHIRIVEEAVARAFEGHTQSRTELTFRHKDGSLLHTLSRIYPVKGPDGEVEFAVVASTDITDRKEAEEALRRERRYLAALLESSPLAIVTLDPRNRIVDCNRAFEELFGYRRQEIVGERLDLLVVPEKERRAAEHLTEQVQAGERVRAHGLRQRKDGSLVEVEIYGVPVIVEEDGQPTQVGIYAIYHDLSERRRLEEQLREAQKLEAVGRLAGGVAHAFNNLLTGIRGYTDLVLAELPEDSPHTGPLRRVRGLSQRAAELTGQLLAFGRRQALEAKVIDLNAVIEGSTEMLRTVLGRDIRLTLALEPGLGNVRADATEIRRVLAALAGNAREAMGEGGELRIETANVELRREDARRWPEIIPGPYVRLAVSDTGRGMDAATRERIFEPFFTTKEAGTAAGLGLATVYGAVKQHGGYVFVASTPGKGTTFTIYLPRTDEPASRPAEEPAPSRRPRRARGAGRPTILLVEDEETVREVVELGLKARGFRVLAAPGPREAEELFALHGREVDLLVTDVVMPGLDGQKLYERLSRARPELRVLYISGYAEDVVERGVEPSAGFLQKPFTPDELAQKVQEVLQIEMP